MTSRIILLAGAMACRGAGPTDADTDPPGNPDSETIDSDLDTVDTEVETDVDTVDTEVETDVDTVDTEVETDSDTVIETDSDAVDTVAESDSDTDSVTVDTETIDTDSVTVDTETIDTDSVTVDTETIDTDSVTVDTETIDTDSVTVDTETIDTDSVNTDTDSITIDTDVDTDSDLLDTDPGPVDTESIDTDPADTDSQAADSDSAPGDTGPEQDEAPRACSLPAGTASVFRPEMLDHFQLNPIGAYVARGFLSVPGAPSPSTVFGLRGTPTALAAASFDLEALWRDGMDAATTILLNDAGALGTGTFSAQQIDGDPEVELVAVSTVRGAAGVSVAESPWTGPPIARSVVTTSLDTNTFSFALGEHDLDGDGNKDLLYVNPGYRVFDPATGHYIEEPPPWPIASVFHGPHTAARDQLAAETVLWGSGTARGVEVIDLDGDGWQDVVIGFPYEGPAMAGKVLAWRGPLAAGTLTEADADIIIEGRPGEGLGNSMTALPDTTGDGIPDLVILSQRGGSFGEGAVWIVPTPVTGGLVGIDAVATGRWSSPFVRPDHASVGETGWAFAAGDMNADGLTDMVINYWGFITHPRGLLSDTGSYAVRDTSDSGADSGDTDIPDTSGWHNGLVVVVPGGLTGDQRLDRGTVRIVNAGGPVPLPDQDGDGYDDLLLERPTDQEGSGIALLRGCGFPTAP